MDSASSSEPNAGGDDPAAGREWLDRALAVLAQVYGHLRVLAARMAGKGDPRQASPQVLENTRDHPVHPGERFVKRATGCPDETTRTKQDEPDPGERRQPVDRPGGESAPGEEGERP